MNSSGEVRILTLWEPWATLIAMNLKRYETRSWGTPYRGKLAIHAAKRPIDELGLDVYLKALELNGASSPCFDPNLFSYGCIVAIADLVNCLLMVEEENLYAWKLLETSQICPAPICGSKEELFEASGFGAVRVDEPVKGMLAVPVEWSKGRLLEAISKQTPLEKSVGDWQPGRYAWKLENICPIDNPIPCKGGQGLRVLQDSEALGQIAQQMALTNASEKSLPVGLGGVLLPEVLPNGAVQNLLFSDY